jgi:cyclopropane fatty-acyl-phospholipid synthase-like methyltransferase
MYNKTHLNLDLAEKREIVHRDYLAHCLRWTHIIRHLKVGEIILDLGCADAPLGMMAYTNKFAPKHYVGVDIRQGQVDLAREKLAKAPFQKTLLALDLCTQFGKIPCLPYTKICCLEFIEHIPGDQVEPFLVRVKDLMLPETMLFLSTPCYDGKNQAGNHIKEWTFQELKAVLERHFHLQAVHGTFLSQKDLKRVWSDAEKELFERLYSYYDSNLLALLFAPLHPEVARNAIWRLSC